MDGRQTWLLTDHFCHTPNLRPFGRPSDLHDLLASVLGLDNLTDTAGRLSAARRSREQAGKKVAAGIEELLGDLAAIDDERAVSCRAALSGGQPDLERAEALATGTTTVDGDGDLDRLRRLAHLSVPAEEDVDRVVESLVAAAQELDTVANTDAGRAAALAQLLEAALAHHDGHGDGACPVCGRERALDHDWHVATAQEMARLKQEAEAVSVATKNARAAQNAVRPLVQAVPLALSGSELVASIDIVAAREAWNAWVAVPDEAGAGGLRGTAEHLKSLWPILAASIGAVAGAASVEVSVREDKWAPLAARVAAWCGEARVAETGRKQVKHIKEAERWLKAAGDEIRNSRLLPLVDEAKAIWGELRQESSVELGAMRLTGSANKRCVAIDVTVDGSAGAALGVMSQGEINALALSIFLPRATLPASPFRFLVIDDPVQAMDPAKVDSLARVLEKAAQHRQVVVFTHDNRLPEAIRRLGIPASVKEITRRPGSKVEVRVGIDPVRRALDDAHAVCAEDALPGEVAARVVGPLCRTALEAVFTEITRHRLLGRGERHTVVEEKLERANSLNRRASLAIFDDPKKAGSVVSHLKKFSKRHATVYSALNGSVHEPTRGDLRKLVDDARWLVNEIRIRV